MHDGRLKAASYVSSHLRSADDALLISDLLDIAAGLQVAARTIDQRRFQLLEQHRVTSLVPAHWELPAAVNRQASAQQRVARQMLLIADCCAVIDQLDDAGIKVRILKGAATSQLDYGDMSHRSFGDIDILVSYDEFTPAIRCIEQSGATTAPPGRTGYEFQQEALLTSAAGNEIDLHYRLCRTAPRTLPALFADPVPLPSGGLALPMAARLAHAASHLMLTPPGLRRLSGVADISAIRSRHHVDLEDVRRFAQLFGCEALVGLGLSIERELRGLPRDTDHWRQPSRLESASYARSNRQMLMEHTYHLSGIGGPRDKLRYVSEWALPTRAGAAKRGGVVAYFQRALPHRFGGQTGGEKI